MKKTLLILTLLVSAFAFAQNFTKGTLSLKTNQSLDGKVFIDNVSKTVLFKDGFDIRSFPFTSIETLQISQENYVPILVNEATFIARELTEKKGKAMVYHLGDNYYLVTNGAVSRSFDIKKEQNVVPGILSLVFNDCNTIRATIAKEGYIDKEDLLRLTQQYNMCAYSTYAPTQNEQERAEKHNSDQASFYVGIGANLNNVSFFDRDDTEGLVSAQLRAGVEASPSFLGNLQGNLFAFLEGSASFSGNNDFSNNDDPVNFSTNSYRLQLGLQYLFNKSGSIQPVLGLGVGATSDSFSGSILENRFDIDGGNPIIAPRVGARFKLNNEHHLGVMLEYITSYENDLTFPTENGVIPLEVGSQNIGLSLSYHF